MDNKPIDMTGILDFGDFLEKTQIALSSQNFNLLKNELYNRLWAYGEHLAHQPSYDYYSKQIPFRVTSKKLKKHGKTAGVKPNILFFSYFNNSYKFSEYNIESPFCYYKKDIDKYDHNLLENFRKKLETCTLNQILSAETEDAINKIKKILTEYYSKNNFKALFLPQDIGFWEKLHIDIFKELKKPTFLYLHGIPGLYTKPMMNRTDYILVWGKKIKDIFIYHNFNKEKVMILNNNKYNNELKKEKAFSLSRILIISNTQNGGQYEDTIRLKNTSNCLLYLEMIKHVLLQLNVKTVLLRCHPGENADWYRKNIDTDFFQMDTKKSLSDVLQEATLTIGPTSSVLFDSLYYGVPYVLFNPSQNNVDLFDAVLVRPFDGSDKNIPCNKNMRELKTALENGICVHRTAFSEYINLPGVPDDYAKIIKIIENQ